MFVLRCTRRLLPVIRRHMPVCTASPRSTTRLGDWYANRLNIAQRRYILVVNARTLLPLVVPARDPAALPDRIRDALGRLLLTIGVDRSAREREIADMDSACAGPARDRAIVASLNAMARRAYDELYDLPHRPGRTLGHIDALLAGAPLPPLGFRTPADVAAAVLARRGGRRPDR